MAEWLKAGICKIPDESLQKFKSFRSNKYSLTNGIVMNFSKETLILVEKFARQIESDIMSNRILAKKSERTNK